MRKIKLALFVAVPVMAVSAWSSPGYAQSQCACKQIKTCWGSWANMSCDQLKSMCARANSVDRAKNGCDRLEQLIGK